MTPQEKSKVISNIRGVKAWPVLDGNINVW